MTTDQFPRRQARTRRFTLGAPRAFRVSADGARVAFIRSDGPEDPVHSLWVLDVATGQERRLLDPRALGVTDEPLSPAEQARRERTRELGEGVVAYTADRHLRRLAAAVNGTLVVVDATGAPGEAALRRPELPGSVFQPTMDPTGRHVACVVDRAVHLVDDDGKVRVLVAPDSPTQSWGMADFIAAEELHRFDAIWWAPDGGRVALQFADEAPVDVWHIAHPATPWRPPQPVRYPAAGTANVDWRLAVFDLDGGRVDVDIDRARYEYLAAVSWDRHGPPLATVLTRDQRTLAVLAVDPATGATDEIHRVGDERWVDPVGGLPQRFGDRLLTSGIVEGRRRLIVDGEALSPAGMELRAVADVDDGGVLLTAWLDDPTQIHLVRLGWDGRADVLTAARPGVHGAVAAGGTTVVVSQSLDHDGSVSRVRARDGAEHVVTSHAADLGFVPEVRLLTLTDRELRCALVLPRDGGSGPLPVLLDPYGGPHAQRVLQSRSAYGTSQWFADQGLAVLVVDGRGTPGRGPAWERAVHGDLAAPVLEDQLDALRAAAEVEPRLDLTRVGIRGWSFGGYLAALAVLARPDVVRVAVAGAPVTDWRLYDTAYSERYLGRPDGSPDSYGRCDLTVLAPQLRRPLLLIHGLADDNVFAAHSLQLSQALFNAGREHSLLLLSETSHMTPGEVTAENLLRIQADFLDRELGFRRRSPSGA